MAYHIDFPFGCTDISSTQPYSQLAGPVGQDDEGAEISLVPTLVNNAGVPFCCENSCGTPIPLVANGSYTDPLGDGKTQVTFNLSCSQSCGIPVAKVLRGNLEGLNDRDELASLNPRANSMRLRIEMPGYEVYTSKINTPFDKLKIEELVRKVCAQIEKFIAKSGAQSQIPIEKLVLVSLKRVSVGCWVPTIRLISGPNGA